MLLKDKVALVTGASRGIGRAISLGFAAEGANLVICSRTESQIQELTAEIRAAGRECLGVVAAVENEADVNRMVAEALATFGRIDILVNNAGLSNPKPFLETTIADWDEALNVNLKGSILCMRAVLPDMLRRGAGKVINIASAAGLRGLPGSPAYAASKAAVIALTQALGDELMEKGLRINVVCPGPVKTELLDRSAVRNFVVKNPATILPTDDVVGLALYLASDMSGGLNSQIICLRNSNRW
ncbi:MAG: SDR family oxidoreductase [Anaerolineae bacterium]|nr:SDR family oxidoreductase [Anaerolineae bacterium]